MVACLSCYSGDGDNQDLPTHDTTEPTAAIQHTAPVTQKHSSHGSRPEPDDSEIEPIDPVIAMLAFRAQRPNLLLSIGSSPSLVNTLYANEIITRSTLDEVTTTLGVSQEMKCLVLLNAVENRIKIVPSAAFSVFVSVLQSEPALEEMGRQLLRSYRKACNCLMFII